LKIFLSWSGDLSRELAEALRDWLPAVLQSVKPFFTPNDIEKGARWGKDISQELQASSYGVFCLTKENLTKPWIMFEAGALSKSIDTSRVCPVLFGVDNADLEGPLVQFQAAPFSETEMRKLIRTLNSGLAEHRLEENVLTSVFDMWWPRLNEKVVKILERHASKPIPTSTSRSDRDLLEEVLQLTRLSATSSAKSSRPADKIDGSALVHSLKNILILCEHLQADERPPLMPIVKEIFDPLKYLGEKGSISVRHERELEDLYKKIQSIFEQEI
jgi:TIR domain